MFPLSPSRRSSFKCLIIEHSGTLRHLTCALTLINVFGTYIFACHVHISCYDSLKRSDMSYEILNGAKAPVSYIVNYQRNILVDGHDMLHLYLYTI